MGTYGFISYGNNSSDPKNNSGFFNNPNPKQNTSLKLIDEDSRSNSRRKSGSIDLNKSGLSDKVSKADSVILRSDNSESSLLGFKINVVDAGLGHM